MAASKRTINDWSARMAAYMTHATDDKVLRQLGEQAALLIRRRTRLGYGAPEGAWGTVERFKLPSLSKGYMDFRQTTGASWLSEFTSARKSNLTFTGQLLDSMSVLRVTGKTVTVGPQGSRIDPFSKASGMTTNQKLADTLAKKGRTFNNLTRLEGEQLKRWYRNLFGDLAKNARIKS
jgi:hypothetical protein